MVDLRYLRVLANALAVVLGLATCIPMGYVSNFFESQCVLYASPVVSLVSNGPGVPPNVSLDKLLSVWGDLGTCDYATFVAVSASIHAFIWTWFYLFMGPSFNKEWLVLANLMSG
jgi:hypothetical protein